MSNGQPIASELRTKYVLNSKLFLSEECSKQPDKEYLSNIDTGLRLGTFLSESGWLEESLNVLTQVLLLIERLDYDYTTLIIELDCLQRLLHAQATFCCFKEAATTQTLALDIVDKIGVERVPNCLLANLYIQISVLHFSRSEYDLSYSWSVKALKKLKQNTPDKIVVDVLRQAAKSCVVKRHFKRANMLITLAVKRAKKVFGMKHQKYADALLDNGFFLLNVDSIVNSVNIYKDALVIRRHIFGTRNFHVAVAHEDLAYALYVHEYSSGRFQTAREHVVKAIDIMKDLVPCNHLMLASAKRVKALILEEIALDNMASQNLTDFDGLLIESEELHQSALQLSLEAFGEINVQTAKHYGNLGRLYQSMTKFKDAEDMHKKAIKIKTDLLGAYDYEVGLSIGHLASLYNYHMKKHRDAEELYLRSITISKFLKKLFLDYFFSDFWFSGLRLFGKTYSGLEYDYRGLCHVYESLHDTDKYLEYSLILESWRLLREENDQGSVSSDICCLELLLIVFVYFYRKLFTMSLKRTHQWKK